MKIRSLLLVLSFFILPAYAAPMQVVASFSILGDMVQQVGGAEVKVHTLVGANADAHTYQPSPADSKLIAQADLVIINGLAFEGWIERLIRSSGYKGKVVVATTGIKALQSQDGEAHGGHKHAASDPHAWQDVRLAQVYVDNIIKALSAARPDSAELFAKQGNAYKQQLDALDTEIRKQLSTLPAQRRQAISTHDAFRYFSKAYGIRFIAPKGVSNDAEPSAKNMARLIEQIRKEKVPAIFLENMNGTQQAKQLQAETGVRMGGTLYPDALSDKDGPAASYIAMMRHNAKTIFTALSE